jgi:hypothetical protein
LTEKCLKQKVVPGLFQSFQATILELWASLHLLGVPGTQIDTSRSHPETQKTTKLDRKMPPAESHPRPLPELSGHRSGAVGFPPRPGTSREAAGNFLDTKSRNYENHENHQKWGYPYGHF